MKLPSNPLKISDILVIVGTLLVAVFFLFFFFGWFLNIFQIVDLVSESNFNVAMFVLRFIGIFVAPLGGILGWV